jgi:hypothetical protein
MPVKKSSGKVVASYVRKTTSKKTGSPRTAIVKGYKRKAKK